MDLHTHTIYGDNLHTSARNHMNLASPGDNVDGDMKLYFLHPTLSPAQCALVPERGRERAVCRGAHAHPPLSPAFSLPACLASSASRSEGESGESSVGSAAAHGHISAKIPRSLMRLLVTRTTCCSHVPTTTASKVTYEPTHLHKVSLLPYISSTET